MKTNPNILTDTYLGADLSSVVKETILITKTGVRMSLHPVTILLTSNSETCLKSDLLC